MAALVACGNAWAMDEVTEKELQAAFKQALFDRNVPEVERLLQAGADPNAKDKSSGTVSFDYIAPALSGSEEKDRKEVLTNALNLARALLNADANPNIQNRDGKNALFVVASLYDPTYHDLNKPKNEIIISEIASLMLQYGANPKHEAKNDGSTPLHVAVRSGNLQLAKLLISKGADINTTSFKGYTPLDFAVGFGPNINPNFEKIMYLLLKNGADPNIKNHEGKTTFDMLISTLQDVYQDRRIKAINKKIN